MQTKLFVFFAFVAAGFVAACVYTSLQSTLHAVTAALAAHLPH